MYILVFIVFVIFLIELYSYFRDFYLTIVSVKKTDYKENDTFLEFNSLESFEIKLEPGKIYTPDVCNLFIIKNNQPILVKKNMVYDMNEPFILKYVKINETNMKYFYV